MGTVWRTLVLLWAIIREWKLSIKILHITSNRDAKRRSDLVKQTFLKITIILVIGPATYERGNWAILTSWTSHTRPPEMFCSGTHSIAQIPRVSLTSFFLIWCPIMLIGAWLHQEQRCDKIDVRPTWIANYHAPIGLNTDILVGSSFWF